MEAAQSECLSETKKLIGEPKVAAYPNGVVTWCGGWRKEDSYQTNSTVKAKDGHVYIAVLPNAGVPPEDHPDVWKLLVE
jgi:hypothetical protein